MSLCPLRQSFADDAKGRFAVERFVHGYVDILFRLLFDFFHRAEQEAQNGVAVRIGIAQQLAVDAAFEQLQGFKVTFVGQPVELPQAQMQRGILLMQGHDEWCASMTMPMLKRAVLNRKNAMTAGTSHLSHFCMPDSGIR